MIEWVYGSDDRHYYPDKSPPYVRLSFPEVAAPYDFPKEGMNVPLDVKAWYNPGNNYGFSSIMNRFEKKVTGNSLSEYEVISKETKEALKKGSDIIMKIDRITYNGHAVSDIQFSGYLKYDGNGMSAIFPAKNYPNKVKNLEDEAPLDYGYDWTTIVRFKTLNISIQKVTINKIGVS